MSKLTNRQKVYLVALEKQTGNKCLLGHDNCPNPVHYITQSKKLKPEFNLVQSKSGQLSYGIRWKQPDKYFYRLYDWLEKSIVHDWIMTNRYNRNEDYKAEYSLRHNLRDRLPLKGHFNGVAQDIYYDSCSMYTLISLGIGVDCKPLAIIQTRGGDTLHIPLDLSAYSRNKRKDLLRHKGDTTLIDDMIAKALKEHLHFKHGSY
jgi:hypothetical protein